MNFLLLSHNIELRQPINNMSSDKTAAIIEFYCNAFACDEQTFIKNLFDMQYEYLPDAKELREEINFSTAVAVQLCTEDAKQPQSVNIIIDGLSYNNIGLSAGLPAALDMSDTSSDSAIASIVSDEEKAKLAAEENQRKAKLAEILAADEKLFDSPNCITVKTLGDKPGLYFLCPHCNKPVVTIKDEIACTIVTHGVTKQGQVPQHLSPTNADAMLASGAVIAGCMKQYTLLAKSDSTYIAEPCSGR